MNATTLIVGGDSKVGGALAAFLRCSGSRVLTTSRRGKGDLFLDLGDCDSWRPPEGVGVAVLAAAVANIEACRRDPEKAARVNVAGLLEVAQRLHAQGTFLVFLSTNAVFGGDRPYPRPDDPPTPRTDYGRQKAEAEKRLRDLDPNVAIVRFGKILEPSVALFAQWKKALRNRQVIGPFYDMSMAPIPMACAVSVLRLIMDCRQGGIYHVSGERDVGYAQIGYWAAELVGADPALVKPVSAIESGRAMHVAQHTALDTEGLRAALGIQPPPVESSIRRALRMSEL
jgi:dTDP-4-dehydrorhamnose reductase